MLAWQGIIYFSGYYWIGALVLWTSDRFFSLTFIMTWDWYMNGRLGPGNGVERMEIGYDTLTSNNNILLE